MIRVFLERCYQLPSILFPIRFDFRSQLADTSLALKMFQVRGTMVADSER